MSALNDLGPSQTEALKKSANAPIHCSTSPLQQEWNRATTGFIQGAGSLCNKNNIPAIANQLVVSSHGLSRGMRSEKNSSKGLFLDAVPAFVECFGSGGEESIHTGALSRRAKFTSQTLPPDWFSLFPNCLSGFPR